MLQSLFDRLNAPFPESPSGKRALTEFFYTGLFVSAFLFFFNPFGLQNMPWGIGISSLVFGLITLVGCLSYQFFLTRFFNLRTDTPSWKLWKWIVMSTGLVVWVAIGNFAYLLLSLPEHFAIGDFPKMLQYTLMVGITPIVVLGMLIQMRAAKQHVGEASTMSQIEQHAAPESATEVWVLGENNALSIDPHDLCAIEAMQNYLMVYHWDSVAGSIRQDMVRATMASVTASMPCPSVIRCHRSFFVNLRKVTRVSGNAQGLKLAIVGMPDREIPVSRSYITAFKAAFLAAK